MRTVLLLGGMTPDVTALYYNTINRVVRSRLGCRSAAPLYMYSANLEEMLQHAMKGDWTSFAKTYEEPILTLGNKIDGVAICAILAHRVSRELSPSLSASNVPLLHIADFLAQHIKTAHSSVRRLGLLGPKITMLDTEDTEFFVGRLRHRHDFEVIVPETEQDIEQVNRGMLEEVAKGAAAVTETTKAMFIDQANKLAQRGAEIVILGSTDLGFVIKQQDVSVPLIEPASVHAEELARWICQDES